MHYKVYEIISISAGTIRLFVTVENVFQRCWNKSSLKCINADGAEGFSYWFRWLNCYQCLLWKYKQFVPNSHHWIFRTIRFWVLKMDFLHTKLCSEHLLLGFFCHFIFIEYVPIELPINLSTECLHGFLWSMKTYLEYYHDLFYKWISTLLVLEMTIICTLNQ